MEIKIICSDNLPDCPKCGEGKMLIKYSKDEDGELLYWKCNHCGEET